MTAEAPGGRIVVAMTGATGQVFGIRALELLGDTECESHLVMSDQAKLNVELETHYAVPEVLELADQVYELENVGATIASGSYAVQGMVIAPCTMKTLSQVATGNAGNLITRAADVCLKERRPLVLLAREKPLNVIHLENMKTVTQAGGIVMPPFLSFYQRDASLSELVSQTTARALEKCGVAVQYEAWEGV